MKKLIFTLSFLFVSIVTFGQNNRIVAKNASIDYFKKYQQNVIQFDDSVYLASKLRVSGNSLFSDKLRCTDTIQVGALTDSLYLTNSGGEMFLQNGIGGVSQYYTNIQCSDTLAALNTTSDYSSHSSYVDVFPNKIELSVAQTSTNTMKIYPTYSIWNKPLWFGVEADSSRIVPNLGTGMTLTKGSGNNLSTLAFTNGLATFNKNVNINNNLTVFGNYNVLGDSSTDSTFIYAFLQDDSKSNLFIGRNTPKTYTGTNGFNLFIGKPSSSLALTTGYYNTILGNIAGDGLTTGFSNVVIGYNSLGASTATSSSVFIGQSCGSSVSSVTNSVTIGALAGQRIAGADMVNIGFHAGLGESALTNSARSIFIGSGAGENTYAAPDDIGIGYAALPNDSATGTGFNIAIGQYTMQNKRRGNYNTVIGSKAVQTLNKNTNNIVALGYNVLNAWNKDTLAPALCAVGTNALSVNTNAVFTAAFGASAMANSTSGGYCNAFGYATLSDYTGAYSNAFGHEAGFSWLTGNYNTLIGMYAGRMQQTGAHNNYLGYNVAGDVTTSGGSNNEYIGSETSRFNKGSNNVFVGHQAGRGTILHTADGCIKIGYQAGYNDTLDNQLFIDNSNTATPLIYGDFSSNQFTINGTTVNAVDTLTRADATPDVSSRNIWKYSTTANTETVTITDLDNPKPNAIYTIIGQSDVGTVTINDGGNFSLAGGVNFTMGLNDVLVLYCIADNNYIEISRSNN